MPRHPSRCFSARAIAVLVTALVLAAIVGCASSPARCRSVPLSPEATRQLEVRAAALDFTPLLPCAFGSNAHVTGVFLDTLPGNPPQPRVTFDVTRGGSRIYLLSHTRAEVRSSAIPLGSHHLRVAPVSDPAIEAMGFAGPAGTGDSIAYLRWRRDEVTTELLATLSPTFTEDDVIRTARALMGDGATP